MKIEQVIDGQKKALKPGKEGLKQVQDFVSKLNKSLKSLKINAEAVLGGSVAKGTHMKEAHDADIFVKFNLSEKEKNISSLLENALKKIKVKYDKVHGSRDYFQINEGLLLEIVPVLSVKDYKYAENVADMSPLHVDYFMKKADKNTRDEIRVAKQFLKAARIYGAESHIKGFSGHVVDLLILNYEDFHTLAKKASQWKDNTTIDMEKHHVHPRMSINTSKTEGPLLIVDPVQKTRNAAAAVSKQSYDLFRKRCKQFLKNPDSEFFKVPSIHDLANEKMKSLKKEKFFMIEIIPLKGKEDVSGSKVLKIKEFIETNANNQGFQIKWSDWDFTKEKSKIVFAFDSRPLPEKTEIKGPPSSMNAHADKFRKAHKKVIEKKGFLYTEKKMKYVLPEEFIQGMLKEKYVLEKCLSAKFSRIQKVF